jgi:hypothetical protein
LGLRLHRLGAARQRPVRDCATTPKHALAGGASRRLGCGIRRR